jgi:peptide/nickel transport system permease protein
MALPDRRNLQRAGRWQALPPFLTGPLGFATSVLATLFGLIAITFLIGRVLPADPVLAILGDRASAETYQRVRVELGIDRPILEQFWTYLLNILHGEFGRSVLTSRPIVEDLARVFPATLELATCAIFLGISLGVPLGVLAATRQGQWPDHVVRLVGLIGYSIPIFWLGLMGLLVFYAWLDLVGGPGRLDIAYDDLVTPVTGLVTLDALIAGDLEVFFNALSHLVLPASLLGYLSLAAIARMTRSFMIDQLSQEYILAARAKGVPAFQVVWRHAFANIRVPLLTVVLLNYASLLEGAVLTETVFAWPGLGLYITNSLFAADLNAVLGSTLLVGTVLILLNLLADQMYLRLDRRTR